ncbi:uncharacterized [Tachysurus ichikawai]
MLRNSTLAGVANARPVIIRESGNTPKQKAIHFPVLNHNDGSFANTPPLAPPPSEAQLFFLRGGTRHQSTWSVVRLRAQPQMLNKWILSMAHEVEIPLSGSQSAHLLFLPPTPVLLHGRRGATPALSLECRNLICGALGAWEKTLRVDSPPLQTDTLGWSEIPRAD